MNPKISFSLFLALLIVTGFQCKHENAILTTLKTGKLVVSGPCEHFVVQLISPVPDSNFVEKSWTDSQTDSTFLNVFSVSDHCTFAALGLSEGAVFTFTVADTNGPVQTCLQCDSVTFTDPTVSHSITNIRLSAH